jgi:dUTP pyrophosphatase
VVVKTPSFGELGLEERAYVLGFGVMRARMGDGRVTFDLGARRRRAPSRLSLFAALGGTRYRSDARHLVVRDPVLERALRSALANGPNASTGEAVNGLGFESPELRSVFLRGCFDAAGRLARSELVCTLQLPSEALAQTVSSWSPAAERVSKRRVRWTAHNALDLIGALYGEAAERGPHARRFRSWAIEQARLGVRDAPALGFSRLDERAVPPQKTHVSDSGYDLTLIRVHSRVGLVTLYGTGIVLEPPAGFYLDVVARSSLVKTGHFVANAVGVIDQGYRGEVLVPLVKFDPGAPDLVLPVRAVQAVPRPVVHFTVERREASSPSRRGAGGFGSTGASGEVRQELGDISR